MHLPQINCLLTNSMILISNLTTYSLAVYLHCRKKLLTVTNTLLHLMSNFSVFVCSVRKINNKKNTPENTCIFERERHGMATEGEEEAIESHAGIFS